MDMLVGIAMMAAGWFLWMYATGIVSQYAAKGKDDPLSMKMDPTARLEVAQRNGAGCVGDIGAILWFVLIAAFSLFVLFYVLPEIGPAVRVLRDLK